MGTQLVTGGAGFIGSHLVKHLLDHGHRVVVLDDLSGGRPENVDPRAELSISSVVRESDVERVFEAGDFEHVYHFAAFTAEGLSHFAKRLNYDVNVRGSINVINAAVRCGVRGIVFASTVGVYGDAPSPLREDGPTRPVDSYGLGKLMIEQELGLTRRQFGLDFVSFRLHNVYGENQLLADPYRNAVGIFINQIMRGEPLSVYGTGEQVRAFTYVSDIVPVIAGSLATTEAFGRVFNVGSSQLASLNQLADAVRVAMGAPDHPIAYAPGRDEISVAYPDTSLARSVFGDWTDTELADGLARTADWARRMGPQELHSWVDIEAEPRHLPAWVHHVAGRLGAGYQYRAMPAPSRDG
jgi:UDP-glucose 4-epimerase